MAMNFEIIKNEGVFQESSITINVVCPAAGCFANVPPGTTINGICPEPRPPITGSVSGCFVPEEFNPTPAY